jgi:imidazolonepropionase
MQHLLVTDIDLLLTMEPGLGEGPLGALSDAAVWVEGDEVRWVGPRAQAPDLGAKAHVLSARGCVVLPGLVDCHTHAVWAGSRSDEFRARLAGESYTSILQRGGGILSTVAATRDALEDDLVRWGAERLRMLASRGVTTVEIKSGYGLSPEAELKLLRAARQAGEVASVRVLRTFLGAHAIPAEWRHDRDGYVAQVIDEQLPLCAPEEGERILSAGKAWGLDLKVHAEQVIYTGAAAMAAKLGARSADHLERIDDAGIEAMARHGTVAVMLPGAMLYLKDAAPPVARLREAGVPMALATDLNPGSSPLYDPWAAATLACVTMGMTVEEALLGLTRHAASALGRRELGVLRPGSAGDLVVMRPPPGETPSPGALVQPFGGATLAAICRAGVLR